MALNIFDQLINAIPKHELVESDIAFRIAQRIDFLMRKNNLSKSDLARGMDKDPAQISRWMSGVHNFSIKTLAELEIFFKEQILVSPTAMTEVAEYTQYVVKQAEEQRAKKEYEDFKANQVNNLLTHSVIHVVEITEQNLVMSSYKPTEYIGNYQYAMGA